MRELRHASYKQWKRGLLCVAARRRGTWLRKLEGDLKEEKATSNGKRNIVGKHQLTGKQTNALQRCNGKAKGDSASTTYLQMKLGIMSVFWHAISQVGEGSHQHLHYNPVWRFFRTVMDEGRSLPLHSNMKMASD